MAMPWEQDWSKEVPKDVKPWEHQWDGATPEQPQQQAAPSQPQQPAQQPKQLPNYGAGVGFLEVGANLGTGAVQSGMANLAGLGQVPLHAMGLSQRTPEEVMAATRQTFPQYQPHTGTGQAFMQGMNAIPDLYNKSVVEPTKSMYGLGQDGQTSPSSLHGMAGNLMVGLEEQLPTLIGSKVKGTDPLVTARKAELAKKFQKEGLVQSPITDEGLANKVKLGVVGAGNEARGAKILSYQNLERLTQMAKEDVGIHSKAEINPSTIDMYIGDEYKNFTNLIKGAKTEKVMTGVKKETTPASKLLDASGNPMTPAKTTSTPTFDIGIRPDREYRTSIAKTIKNLEKGIESDRINKTHNFDNIQPAMALLRQNLKAKLLKPEDAMATVQHLRAEASRHYKNADSPNAAPSEIVMATAKKGIADAIENAVVKSAPKELGDKMRAARTKIAKMEIIKDALTEYGNIDPKVIAKRDNGQLTGKLQTISEFAKTNPKVAALTENPAPQLSAFNNLLAQGALWAGKQGMAVTTIAGQLGTYAATKKGLLQSNYRSPNDIIPPKRSGARTAAGAGFTQSSTEQEQ